MNTNDFSNKYPHDHTMTYTSSMRYDVYMKETCTLVVIINVKSKESIYMQLKYFHSKISLLPFKVWITSPVSAFHILIVLSHDPDAIFKPSGETAKE